MIYEVWSAENGGCREHAKRLTSVDAESAAELWAAWTDSNSAEYSIVSGEDAEVCVSVLGSDIVTRFVVSGESVPRYFATEKE